MTAPAQPAPRRFSLGCLGTTLLVGALFLVGILLGVVVSSNSTAHSGQWLYGSGDKQIAVVHVSGIIVEGSSQLPLTASGEITTPSSFNLLLRDLAADESVAALLIRVNSPGGSAVASEEMYQAIQNFKATSVDGVPRKVVVSIGDTAASGGYYIASAADHIVANHASVTGSIGVIAEITNISGLYEKVGLESEVYKSGEFKDLLSSTRERTPEEQAMVQSLVDSSYEVFLGRVAEGRGMSINQVRQFAEGRIYSGQEAMQVGLVDSLGTFDNAVVMALRLTDLSEAQVIEYRSEGFFDTLFGVSLSPFWQSLLARPPLRSGVVVQYLLAL